MNKYNTLLKFCLILACLLISIESTLAQSTTIDILNNNKIWRIQFPGKKELTMDYSFSKTERTDIFTFNENVIKKKSYFYLSDQPIKKFDPTKVGKAKNGKYIIINLSNSKTGEATLKVYEIVELTSSEMKLKDLLTYEIISYKVI